MIWNDDQERALACRRILSTVRLEGVFIVGGKKHGPLRSLEQLVADRSYSDTESIMLRLAYDIWNESGKFDFVAAMRRLDETRWRVIVEFLDAWSSPGHEKMTAFNRHLHLHS